MKENNNLFIMSHQSSAESDDKIPSHPSKDANFEKKQDDPFLLSTQESQNHDDKDIDATQNSSLCKKQKMDDAEAEELTTVDEELEEVSERERLKRHRVEVAGRVWIPEIWGQEELLKDWIDCTAFDAPLIPSKITMARAALVQQGAARANAAPLSIDNRDLEFNVHKDLSLNNNCTNVDVQNTQVFRQSSTEKSA
ncbi:protein BIC1-like [Vicia villosa]|uniref:protein BIC1-like n=1 Tax=Vicia villosa TaxID=3911 RepID=UPI00273CB34A|nr:protein BIC1-like [Vicia villosa]